MKKFFLFLIITIPPLTLFAEGKPDAPKAVLAYKIKDLSIKLDGKLTESIWHREPIKDFIQRDPKEGSPATEKTEVWIAYDEDNLYVAAHLYDDKPDSIDVSLARRDGYSNSDWFGFYVDAFNDKSTGNYFGVNAGGTLVDGVLMMKRGTVFGKQKPPLTIPAGMWK